MTASTILARAPLPLLALSAAWGVWQFQAHFVPWEVAALSAVAFEAVWLGIAYSPARDARRARIVALCAVLISATYNALAAALYLQPDLMAGPLTLPALAALALLHGAPLATLGYALADVLVHAAPALPRLQTLPEASGAATPPAVASQVAEIGSALPACPHCGANLPSRQHMGAAARYGCSPTCSHRMALKEEASE